MDFKALRGGEPLLFRDVDEVGNVSFQEVTCAGMHGKIFNLKEMPGVAFERSDGTRTKKCDNPIPDSWPRCVAPSVENLELLAKFKAGTLPPLTTPEEARLYKAVLWLRSALFEQIVGVVDVERLKVAAGV